MCIGQNMPGKMIIIQQLKKYKQMKTKFLLFAVTILLSIGAMAQTTTTWQLTPTMTATLSSEGVMTISTTANSEAMPNYHIPYNTSAPPWYGLREKIYSIVIEDKVTGLGTEAFYGCDNVTTVKLILI